MSELNRQLDLVASEITHFNYLPIVQSSGYGKTRAVYQLAASRPLIYMCFREERSSGYPYKTPGIDSLLEGLQKAITLETAVGLAQKWIDAMVSVFLERRQGFRSVRKNSNDEYQMKLLYDEVKQPVTL